MGRIVIKKPKPTISQQRIMQFGRQSSMRPVYEDREALLKPEKDNKTEKHQNTKKENKKDKTETVMMDTKQKIELANEVLAEEAQIKAKRIKKDKGLIERKENTIILTEDNRELLKD